jgi:hypothetical protein
MPSMALYKCSKCGATNGIPRKTTEWFCKNCHTVNHTSAQQIADDRAGNRKIVQTVVVAFIVVVVMLATFTWWDKLGTDDCSKYNDKLSSEMTTLQMADSTLGFTDSELLACQIIGPPPSGCHTPCA